MIKKISKFIFGTLMCVFISCAGVSIYAMNNSDIDTQIYHAKRILAASEKELSEKDMELFSLYKQNRSSTERHLAEIKLREKYPEEYSRYIEAKINLDDLMYLQFLIMVNQLGKDE